MGKAIRRQTAFSIHCLERHWAACVAVPIPGKTLCGLFSREFNCGWEVDSEKGRLSPAQGASEPASLNKQKCFKINFVFVLPKSFKINSVFVLEREREYACSHTCEHTCSCGVREHFLDPVLFLLRGSWGSSSGPACLSLTHLSGLRSWYFYFQAVGDSQKRKHALLGNAGPGTAAITGVKLHSPFRFPPPTPQSFSLVGWGQNAGPAAGLPAKAGLRSLGNPLVSIRIKVDQCGAQ